ncbi:glycoside hydrolase family 15 protein [Actinomadura rudentiformis]|uniref:Glucan 1,4-alpha-glucosidase n=1 Tax=Actinomadura rudentiformis TaxID=359158 RepID=A0A6H9YTC2_9ACTN|nr:glycoside hydrolase family 15 protein [Actinomadura rudentiformis]KAB2344432.1 glucan 1,4-alpha-glucosidase [Actinomadura rudentiformis]
MRVMIALVLILPLFAPSSAWAAAPEAPGAPGGGSSWTTGDKSALGTATTTGSKVWFTVAKGVTSEVFYPRADVANVQDMQYVVTDGSSFVDLERDATTHAVSMPDEKALEYTVTNTARSGRYRITNTYVTDPARSTLLVRTRFQSLDGGPYQLYVLYNPSLAGGGGSDTGAWDAANGALVASDPQPVFGGTVASALKSSAGFTRRSTGYSATASDGYRDLQANKRLTAEYDATSGGNIVQTAQIPISGDSTFTLALGFGPDRAAATASAGASLNSGFAAAETSYRTGWHGYLDGLAKPVPASVSGDTKRRRTYNVSVMGLHAAEDKTFRGANVASLSTPWGDYVNGDALNDGYHRVWGRDLYQQATALLAAGDTAQAGRMARWLWDRQQITAWTQGDGVWYGPGSFPRYSPVSGVGGATPQQLGCCEQLDQDAFAIVLAWQTGLTGAADWNKIKLTADHIARVGPRTPGERWEEQDGISPSTVAAEIAGLVCAADIARRNGDTASAARYESTADSWRDGLDGWTFTTTGYFGDRQYYERIEHGTDPNDTHARTFHDGTWWERDIVDGGFLELVRLGIRPASHPKVTASLPELDGVDSVTTPGGAVYWHRYNHDSYGESQDDGTGWPANHGRLTGRVWPLLSGERGEYELAAGRPANSHLQAMADSADQGYLIPEQAWDRADQFGFVFGKPTGSAAPLAWAQGQYVRLAQSITAGRPVETPLVVADRYLG